MNILLCVNEYAHAYFIIPLNIVHINSCCKITIHHELAVIQKVQKGRIYSSGEQIPGASSGDQTSIRCIAFVPDSNVNTSHYFKILNTRLGLIVSSRLPLRWLLAGLTGSLRTILSAFVFGRKERIKFLI